MISPSKVHMPTAAKYAAIAALLAVGTGAAFAGWAAHGPDIFVTMIQSGLSWCF